ncbi:MAG: pyrimidine-nucleoside phosphorylase [Firmicutes bacterium HGW-Firmicutes-1]|nr:MAG: pyrimidine-nucleoside phosphorylase [Firmicutes bacterium HGW-Firmicutes-1]
MRMYDLIEKKKMGHTLTEEEIHFIIDGFTNETIPDYQMSALLMAIYFQGMSEQETLSLTMAMAKSGDMLDLSEIEGIKVDKHSTGGVGDKTSLILAPMVAALGIPVAKMSGRGLGHTGGTIDKLDSFPGLSTKLSKEKFIENVNTIKMAIAGQTANLAPADKKIYALRDVTATVDNISLIASSIMSKKIASGSDGIVLDVKTGSGAFMKEEEDAFKLAVEMVNIGNGLDRETIAVISDMNQPLGKSIGNALEVIEAIQTLKGEGPADLLEICLQLGSYMVVIAGKAKTPEEGVQLLLETINSGTAYNKFKQFVEAQGGDASYVDEIDKLPKASIVEEVTLSVSGYIKTIDTEELGFATMMLGGGRETKDSEIDLAVGYMIEKKIGDYVSKGEPIAFIHGNDKEKMEASKKRFVSAFTLSDVPTLPTKFIKGIVTKNGINRF